MSMIGKAWRIRVVRRPAIAVGIAVLLTVSSNAPALAGAKVRVYRIYYNSPGSDDGSDASLNAEWIQLKNTGNASSSLKGWTIRDKQNHVYQFGSFTLRAGKTVKVHTGEGSNTATDRYWGSGNYIWNNTGDKATLKNSGGTTIDTCSYSGGGDSVTC